MKEILDKVKEYIDAKDKKWEAGKDFVNYAGPYFSADETVAAVESLLKGWLVAGNDCARFEHKFPLQFGKKYGILTNSGSSANLLMVCALSSKRGFNLAPGSKIIVPAAGFPTTFNPIIQLGYLPILVDIELDTLNIDIDLLEKVLEQNPDAKAIMFAHVLGNPPNMDRIMELVEKYNLILLEDCCDALGSTYNGKPLGSFGDMASCSFYPAHHITMGEGGFVSCNSKEIEDVLRSFREWGRGCYCSGPEANKLKCGSCKKRFSNWIPALPDQIFDHKYVYDEIGYNLKPMELQGSIGLKQLDKLEYITQRRKENYKQLLSIFEKYEDFFYIPRATECSDPSWFAFPLTIKKDIIRADLIDYLENNLIQTRPYFAGNILLQPAYSNLVDQNLVRTSFPKATYSMLNTFFLGTSPVVTSEQIMYIGTVIDTFMEQYVSTRT